MKTREQLEHTPYLMIRNFWDDGGCGEIFYKRLHGSIIWSFGCGWEHVSVAPFNRRYIPSWEDMCVIKDMFFLPDEVVVEYHPAKKDYVNMIENCLHLWRPTKEKLPVPPSIMVGIRDGQTIEEAIKEIDALYASKER